MPKSSTFRRILEHFEIIDSNHEINQLILNARQRNNGHTPRPIQRPNTTETNTPNLTTSSSMSATERADLIKQFREIHLKQYASIECHSADTSSSSAKRLIFFGENIDKENNADAKMSNTSSSTNKLNQSLDQNNVTNIEICIEDDINNNEIEKIDDLQIENREGS